MSQKRLGIFKAQKGILRNIFYMQKLLITVCIWMSDNNYNFLGLSKKEMKQEREKKVIQEMNTNIPECGHK